MGNFLLDLEPGTGGGAGAMGGAGGAVMPDRTKNNVATVTVSPCQRKGIFLKMKSRGET